MTLDGLRHLCFDKDGVLIDVHSYWTYTSRLRARRIASSWGLRPAEGDRLLESMGICVGTGRIKPGGPVGYEPRPVVLGAVVSCLLGLGHKTTPEGIGTLFEQIDAEQQSRGDYKIDLLPGVREFMDGISRGGVILSIYSSDRAENTRQILAKLGIAERFSAVVGGGDVSRGKPDPEGFLKACAAVGAKPEESGYVSDTRSDLQMGRAGGAKLAIGVTSGLDSAGMLAAEAHRVVSRLDELL